MSMYGYGAEIRNGHSKRNTVWREGFEVQSAGESYDFVAQTVADRISPKNTPMSADDQRRSDSAQAGLDQVRRTVRRMIESQSEVSK